MQNILDLWRLYTQRKKKKYQNFKNWLNELMSKRFDDRISSIIHPPSWPYAWRLIRSTLLEMIPQPYRPLFEDVLPQGMTHLGRAIVWGFL